jgi:hypothetical protein
MMARVDHKMFEQAKPDIVIACHRVLIGSLRRKIDNILLRPSPPPARLRNRTHPPVVEYGHRQVGTSSFKKRTQRKPERLVRYNQ